MAAINKENGKTSPLSAPSYGEITEKNLGLVKTLNSAIFPVKYNDKFYKDLLNHVDYCKLAYQNDVLVGAICCRVEPKVPGSPGLKLYIMTLGVLAPYRQCGIVKDKPLIEEIYLHVQTNNQDAINFYKRFNFDIVDEIKNYYKRIEPPDCYVLQRKLKQ